MKRLVLGLAVLLLTGLLLTGAAPSYAGFGRPHRVSPGTEQVVALDQATDDRGATTFLYGASDGFDLRVRKADGTLRAPENVVPLDRVTFTSLQAVAVDRDGDGIVVWDEEGETIAHATLYARRFSRHGALGPIVRVSQRTPLDDSVVGVHAAVQPTGRAVVTWNLQAGSGYKPYVRMIARDGARGPIRQVGPGPNADAPLILMRPTGRALLLWNNDAIMARYLGSGGTLLPLHRVRGELYPGEQPTVDDAAFDGRGIVVVGCDKSARVQGPTGPQYCGRACVARISPHLRLIGKLRAVSPSRAGVVALRRLPEPP